MEQLKHGKVRVIAQCDDACYTNLIGTDIRLIVLEDYCRLGIDLNGSFHKSEDASTNSAAQRLANQGGGKIVALRISDAWFVKSLRWLDLPSNWSLEIDLRYRWPAFDVEPAVNGNELVLLRVNTDLSDDLQDTWEMNPEDTTM